MAPHTSRSSLAFLAIGYLAVSPVGILAQTSTAVCYPWFQWMYNSDNQDPCVVSAYLQGACNNGQFTVDALPHGTHYTGPYADQQNPCQCSSVTYNTVSACGLCQNHTFISWNVWNVNCTTVYPGTFPPGIPDGTAVPQWAFQDVTTSDLFNITLAQSIGDNPESTAVHVPSTGSLVPTLTGASASLTAAPSATKASSDHSSNTGVIAGCVVGGAVGVALIAGVVFFLTKRKRSQISPSQYTAQNGISPMSPPSSDYSDAYSSQVIQPKLYDPSDPSTFPTSLATLTTAPSDNAMSYSAVSYPNPSARPGHYSGVPEI